MAAVHPSDLSSPLRILHVFRAPVGGLFRHVSDLARLQAALAPHLAPHAGYHRLGTDQRLAR